MKYRSFEYIIVLFAILASMAMIRLDATPYSTDEMNYEDATKLLSQGKIATKEFTHAFIQVENTYYPSQPIGYPIFSLPFYWLFSLESKLFSQEPLFYFSSDFYPPERDNRGTFYWLENTGTIKVYSKKNELIKFGFSGISFAQDRKVNISFQNEYIFDKTVSIYPQWYETYFPARKGWNEIRLDAGDCSVVSEVKNTDDYRCVSLMLLNPEFVAFVATPFIERSEVYSFSGEKIFALEVTNPNTFPVKMRVNFVAKASQNSSLHIRIGGMKYKFDISENPVEIFTDFITLEPDQTSIEFEVSDCAECLVIFERIKFYLEKDFYDENFIYGNGFFLQENKREGGWRLATNEADLIVFSDNEKDVEFQFDIISYAQSREMRIYVNGTLVNEKEILPSSKIVLVHARLQAGKNIITFQADSCISPSSIETEEKVKDHRCLGFAISN